MDYAVLRERMIKEQLIPRGIKNLKVLDIFSKLERHIFIPEELRDSAYADFPLPIGEGQTISQPFIVALMTECLDLSGQEKILEIGTGSGYQTAILAQLGKEVYTVEHLEVLLKRAQATLMHLGYENIKIKLGDGTLGWPEQAPFDRIIITAAAPAVPQPLTEQLAERGRLILPLGDSFSQVLTVWEKKKGRLYSQNICGCVFVPLWGKYGWQR